MSLLALWLALSCGAGAATLSGPRAPQGPLQAPAEVTQQPLDPSGTLRPEGSLDAPLIPAPAAGSLATLHPLLMGSLSEERAPLALSLDRHASALAGLQEAGAGEAADYLLGLLRGPALDVASAGLLARLLAEPHAAGTLLRAHPGLLGSGVAELAQGLSAERTAENSRIPGVASLARAAREDPTLRGLFDGGRASLELDGLDVGPHGLLRDGLPLRPMGRGTFGAVELHPRIPGAVIKTLFHRPDQADPARAARNDAAWDVHTGELLHRAGVGPRILGRSDSLARPVIVKERVYGRDLWDLMEARRFGRAEYALVLQMLERMAEARVMVDDMRMANIMIGHTLVDPSRRAYIVDGGVPVKRPPGISRRRHLRALWNQETQMALSADAQGRETVWMQPFHQILEEGLEASGAAGSWLTLRLLLRSLLGRDRPRLRKP